MATNQFSESEELVKKSTIGFIDASKLPKIVQEFNAENGRQRPSILKRINPFGISLFKYRILNSDQVRLVQRNGIPELAGHSGIYQRRRKIWTLWKPWTWFRIFRDNSHTVGIYSIADINQKGYIGYGDRHLVSVNQGEYAKVIVDGQPILLDEGVHILKTNNFRYINKAGKDLNLIRHENLYRIQVPSAKIAAVSVDNQPYLLETGTYFIRSNNLILNKPETTDQNQLFYKSYDPVIQCGSLLRLMPIDNTVAVYYQNGKRKIFPEISNEKSNREILINDPNVSFCTFLPTDLNNREYPSSSPSARFEYYTQDFVRVGVRLFVAYRIASPELVLQKLKPADIDSHIEHVTRVDMNTASQKTYLGGIQGYNASMSNTETNANPPPYDAFLNTCSGLVESQLAKHLAEYGIELVRLNIEVFKILDTTVEKKISEWSHRFGEINSRSITAKTERQIAEQEAQTKSAVAQIKATQETKINIMQAQAANEVAALEAEGLRVQAQAEADACVIAAQAEAKKKNLEGEMLKNNPILVQVKLAETAANALKPTDKVLYLDQNSSDISSKLLSVFGLFNTTLSTISQQHINSAARQQASNAALY